MRAVNLIPDAAARPGRPSRGGTPSSNGVYFVLAGLAALVVLAAVWTMTSNQIDSRTAKLEKVNAEAKVAEQRAAAAAPYQEFAELARNRKATVVSLSTTRFDWAHGLREVARVVPADVWLIGITGNSGASGAPPDPTTSAAPAPTFEMKGCTRSQAKVARLMARLRAVDGVRSVELKSSEKPEDLGSDDCPANKATDPAFTLVISFAIPGAAKAPVDSTGQVSTAPPAPASTTAPATGATPNPTTPAKG